MLLLLLLLLLLLPLLLLLLLLWLLLLVQKAFEEFGPVDEAVVIMMRDDPTMSRGFGFVVRSSKP